MNFFRLGFIILLLGISSMVYPRGSFAKDRFFDIQSIDTMKISRDEAENTDTTTKIPLYVQKAAALHPTHIAVATPYDIHFYPVLKKWADEIHKVGLNVWFRGNFSGWEGWFGYPKFKDPNEHLDLTARFIISHPELFHDGDIFTPVPEPENGGFGDPRNSEDIKSKFFEFLPKSYDTCKQAFSQIEKNVSCGYFSVNGDVARLFTAADVQKTGGVLVIDHYVKTAQQLANDIKEFHNQVNAPIVLGEYGAPITDIHGDLTDAEQSNLIHENLVALAPLSKIVKGINYWTAFGGTTSIFQDDLQPKPAARTILSYFSPRIVTGTVVDESEKGIPNAVIEADGLPGVKSDGSGIFRLVTTVDFPSIHVKKDGYFTEAFQLPAVAESTPVNRKIVMRSSSKSLIELIKYFLHRLGL